MKSLVAKMQRVVTFITKDSKLWLRSGGFRDHNGCQRRISTKETKRKNAQKLADEYEKASRTKRTLKQAQAVLDRLHEELSGEKVVRIGFRQYLNDWLKAKDAETARTTMTFYRGSLNKFVHFLGNRSDEPIREITKQDVVAFRNSLIKKVSAKTANHDLIGDLLSKRCISWALVTLR